MEPQISQNTERRKSETAMDIEEDREMPNPMSNPISPQEQKDPENAGDADGEEKWEGGGGRTKSIATGGEKRFTSSPT